MENATDALKMAAAVLIFVLAISITILSFGQVRQASDTILDYRDRETTYIDGNYYYKTNGTERQVGWETVLPTIMRAYLENYKIVFDKELLGGPIYTIKREGKEDLPKYSLDLETTNGIDYQNVSLANEKLKAEFLCGILYHEYKVSKQDFNEKFNIEIGDNPLKDMLDKKTIIERLGVYYQNDDANVPDVNKTQKRIITYSQN